MRQAGYTKQERSLIALMRVWAIIFIGASILFALAPDYVPDYLTRISTLLLHRQSSPLPPTSEHFWHVLAITMLILLSYLCLIVQHNIVRNIGYVRPVILAKFASSAGFLFCFFSHDKHFVYLTGAIVDGIICTITWRFYSRAIKSRTY